jgi:hypothetical protein
MQQLQQQQHLKNITINSFADTEHWRSDNAAFHDKEEEEERSSITMFNCNL